MSDAARQLYAIVRWLADDTYATGEPPTKQDMADAVIAYEVEQRHANGGEWVVPDPNVANLRENIKVTVTTSFQTTDPRGDRFMSKHARIARCLRDKDPELFAELITAMHARTAEMVLEDMKAHP